MMRDILQAGYQTDLVSPGAPRFLRPAGRPDWTTDLGTTFARGGSIIGLSCICKISSHVTNGTLTLKCRHFDTGEGSPDIVFTAESPTISANGIVSWNLTQAAGIDLFDADERITLELVGSAGSDFKYKPIAFVELEFDEP